MVAGSRIEADGAAVIPMRTVGPLHLTGALLEDEVKVPLATFESPLWPSVERGARVTARAGGIAVSVLAEGMTRSIVLEAATAAQAVAVALALKPAPPAFIEAVQAESRFAKLEAVHTQVVGRLLFVRLTLKTGDAAGHNMVTKAADQALRWLTQEFEALTYVSVSGNYCTDKKVSAVNGILGRGRYMIAETRIPARLCRRYLKTTPAAIATLNQRKNLIGSIIAGSLRSANAHYANMLLAFYLATGQDAANIVEGSQGLTTAETAKDELYFACTLPNIIVGTVGNGKNLDFVRHNLKLLGCSEPDASGTASRRLAAIAAAVVLCGELSLLAAQTNPGELMEAHTRLEREVPNHDE